MPKPFLTHFTFYLTLVLIFSLPTTQANTKTPQAFLSAQNTTDLKAGSGSNYSNSQSTKHQTSNIDVVGNLNIQADNINIQGSKVSANNSNIESDNLVVSSVQDSKSVQMKSKSSGGFFGGSSKSTSNSQKTTNQGSELDIANNLTIQNQQTQIMASKVKAKTIQITTDLLKLISDKDLDYLKQTSDSSGFLTRTITDKGHNKERKITTQIQASNQLTINQQTLTKLTASSINNPPTNTQRETLKQLTSADNLKASFDKALKQQLKDKNINLVDVKLNNQDWDESTTTLSGLGKIIVQVAAMYFAGGFDILGSAAGTQLTAQQAFTQAAITSVKSQMVSALATSAITGNSLNLDLEQMLKTALTAGASQYAMNSLSIQTKYDATKDFNTNLVGGLQRAGVNSVVSTAINGGSLTSNLQDNLGLEVLSVTTAKLANKIGANQDDLGDVGHKAAHAVLGCAGAKVQGKDCASGAVGAVAGEVIAEHVGQNQDLTDDDVQAISRMGTAVIAQGLGKDTEVADQRATNAIENNYLTVREQINQAKEITECGKNGHQCKNDVRKKYQAIYDKNQQEKIAEINKELSKPAFLRTKSNQEIKSAIDLVDNRPFKEEITKIPEQNLYGVEVISDERYVSRVEVQTKEDLKDVAEAGVSLTAPGRIYTYGKYVVDAIKDVVDKNPDRTIKNLVDLSAPKILRKAGVPKTGSEVIPESIKLLNELEDE